MKITNFNIGRFFFISDIHILLRYYLVWGIFRFPRRRFPNYSQDALPLNIQLPHQIHEHDNMHFITSRPACFSSPLTLSIICENQSPCKKAFLLYRLSHFITRVIKEVSLYVGHRRPLYRHSVLLSNHRRPSRDLI